MTTRFSVIGDGAMGTACALILAKKAHHEVALWCQFPENCQVLNEQRENTKYLPGVPIPESIRITNDFAAVRDADAFIIAVPTPYLSQTLQSLQSVWPVHSALISVVKGIEQETFRCPSQILSDLLAPSDVAVLSGPSHAEEISRELPASVVAASGNLQFARKVQGWFNTDRFRVYTIPDVIGTELAAALKNVIAIAAGICDGLGLGDNAKSALMTRGLVEISRFGQALGAEPDTFHGLAGLGDLITTCISPHGRNRAVGVQLGQGKSVEDILHGMDKVAEGVWSSRSIYELAQQKNIDMPVTTQVYQILYEKKSPLQAVDDLMSREPKPERP